MKNSFISFTLGLFGFIFISLLFIFFGGSKTPIIFGFAAFVGLITWGLIHFAYKFVKTSSFRDIIIMFLYILSAVVSISGLVISYLEGLQRQSSTAGFKIFFVGLGAIIFMLIITFIKLFFSDEKDFK